MKGLPRSLSRGAQDVQEIIKVSIPVKDLAVSITDVPGAAGWGSSVMAGLPQGNLLFLGAVAYLAFSSADANVTATYVPTFAVGTTATADSTLSTTEVDIVPSTASAAAAAKVTPFTRAASTDALGGGVFDNTDGSLELNLNVSVADAGITGNAVIAANGVIHIALIVLGDD